MKIRKIKKKKKEKKIYKRIILIHLMLSFYLKSFDYNYYEFLIIINIVNIVDIYIYLI